MLQALQILSVLMVTAAATAVVFTRDPTRQAVVLSVYGVILTVFFLVLQAPDVALSELTVGAAALPLMILVALAKTMRLPATDAGPVGDSGPAADPGEDGRDDR
jgi:energy-converting hydrogenase B subunit D